MQLVRPLALFIVLVRPPTRCPGLGKGGHCLVSGCMCVPQGYLPLNELIASIFFTSASGVSDHLHVNKVFLEQAQKVEDDGQKDPKMVRKFF